MTNSTLVLPRRPWTVSLASGLLYLLALFNFLGAVGTLVFFSDFRQTIVTELARNPASTGTLDNPEQIAGVATAIVAAMFATFAVLALLLGRLNARGRNGARIVTWIWAGLGLCSGCVSMTGATVAPSGQSSTTAAGAETAFSSGFFVTLLVIVVLLALPSSNAYFRQVKESRRR